MVAIDDIVVKSGNNNYGFIGGVTSDDGMNVPRRPPRNEHVGTNIFSQTQCGSNEHFVFLWVCQNADVEGSSNSSVHDSICMEQWRHTERRLQRRLPPPNRCRLRCYRLARHEPLAYLLHGNIRSLSGNSGTPNIFKYFLVFFYYYALRGYDWYSVNQALDMASYTTGYYNFEYATFAYPNRGYWTYFPWDTNMSATLLRGLCESTETGTSTSHKAKTLVVNHMNRRFTKLSITVMIGAIVAVLFLQLPVAFSDDVKVSASEKAMAFITNVVGLDVAKYSVQVRVSKTTDSGLFDKVVKYNLTSTESMLDVISLFRNNKLVWCKLYPIQGAPLFIQTASTSSLDAAKAVIDRLQNYSTTTYCLRCETCLTRSLNKTAPLKVGNVRQRISFGVGSEDFNGPTIPTAWRILTKRWFSPSETAISNSSATTGISTR